MRTPRKLSIGRSVKERPHKYVSGERRPTLWAQLLGAYADELVEQAHRDFEATGVDGPEDAE